MFNNKFSRLLPHPGYNVGGGIGEAALIGAAFSGGKALITGEDPLQAALLGGVTGGAMSGLTQGAQGLLGATNTAAATGNVAPSIAAPSIQGTVQNGVIQGANTGLNVAGAGGMGSQGIAAYNGAVAPNLAATNMPAQGVTGLGGMQPIIPEAGVPSAGLGQTTQYGVQTTPGTDAEISPVANAPQGAYDRIRGMINPEAGGTLDRAFDFANANPGPTAGIAGALYGAAFPKQMGKEEEEEEESPLAGYDRKDFTAYEAPRPDPYPQAQYTDYFKYGKEGGVMQSYAGGGIAALAQGGYPMARQNTTQFASPSQMPMSAEVVNTGYEPVEMAEGGVARFFGGGDTGGGQVFYDSNTGQYYTQGNSVGMGAMGFGNRSRNYIDGMGGGRGSKMGTMDVDPSVGDYSVAPVENYYEAKYSEPTTPIQYNGPQGGVADYYTLADSVPLLAASNPSIGAQFAPPAPASMASGGIAGYSLGGYAAGGNPRLLKGPGDGMSDNIPATIGGKQPARLADGEFVVPADVVSHLGNGSTDAGAKHLYKMMDRVRKARTGNKKQGKQINPSRFMPR